MKKYPVTYKEKEYEVRWEHNLCFNYVTIYKVNKILGIKYCVQVYSVCEYDLERYLIIKNIYKEDNPNYHIEEVKALFDLMELEIITERNKKESEKIKQQALIEWDGVIDEN